MRWKLHQQPVEKALQTHYLIPTEPVTGRLPLNQTYAVVTAIMMAAKKTQLLAVCNFLLHNFNAD